jgi:phage replication O-like protein O
VNNPWKSKSKINPQAENGHRRIANDVLDALIKQKMTGSEWAVCMMVIDKTYGHQKLCDRISLTQFQQRTGFTRQGVINAISGLEGRHILVVNHTRPITEFLFNKHYDTWEIVNQSRLPVNSQPELTTLVNQSLPKVVNQSRHTKERKKSLQKKTYSQNSFPFLLASLLLDKIVARRPTFKKPDLQKWAKTIDRMIRLDQRDPAEIQIIIEWSQTDKFWQNNILSTEKLREKYDQLALKAQKTEDWESAKRRFLNGS